MLRISEVLKDGVVGILIMQLDPHVLTQIIVLTSLNFCFYYSNGNGDRICFQDG